MMTILLIIFIIVSIFIFIQMISFISEENYIGAAFMACYIISLFGLYVAVIGVQNKNAYMKEVKETYTMYLDGVEVDAKKIDLEFYKYKINDDTKEVYMTRR